MSRYDPVDRNLIRLELRRFQTRCEAQQGMIRRADTIHELIRLGSIPLPYMLVEETEALDARRQLKQTAEDRARELFEALLDRFAKAEPIAREKLRRAIDEDVLLFSGSLANLRAWAFHRIASVEQALPD